jgi:hypothetical protein
MGEPSRETKRKSNMRIRLALPLTALILFGSLFLAMLIVGAGVLLVGSILSQIFSVSVFEASLISLGVGLAITYALIRITIPQHVLEPMEDEDWEEDEQDFEDEEENIVPPRSRNDPCPCGSGRKYKNCHGRVT